MSKISKKQTLVSIRVIFGLLLFVFFCSWLLTPVLNFGLSSDKWNSFQFNPDSVIADISENRDDVFVKIDSVIGNSTRPEGGAVEWAMQEFFNVADEAHFLVWNESLSSWNLDIALFTLGCEDIEAGPQDVVVTLSKTERTGFWHTLHVSTIILRANLGTVVVHQQEYYPSSPLRGYFHQSASFDQFRIPSEQALSIAEENRGSERGLGVGDNCQVLILFDPSRPGRHNTSWHVEYYDEDNLSSDVIYHVNISTGMIEQP